MATLFELCSLIRSKNAGPFVLTFDLMFSSPEAYLRVKRNNPLTAAVVAKLYNQPESAVKVSLCDGAQALKISIPRPVIQSDPGDSDCYGGQQYVPLLSVVVD
jgi:hypothetical protein